MSDPSLTKLATQAANLDGNARPCLVFPLDLRSRVRAPLEGPERIMAAENVIRLLGRYSEGYRLAATHGPSSGIVAEYAYRNTPRGQGPLGRFLDRRFLHNGVWDGVRLRFQVTQQLVREERNRRRAEGRKTTILDVASGTACYLRELLRLDPGTDLEVFCRERDPKQVMHARELAAGEGIEISFFVGDATDEASYLCARDPDIIIASGLLPLLRRDDVVRSFFRLVVRHLAVDGCFILTTITDPAARLSPWETALRLRPAARSADRVASWLRATGFDEVECRRYAPDAVALVARKRRDL